MEEDCPYLFVYGTLRDSTVNHKAHYLNQHAIHFGKGHIHARLYKVTWYPAIRLMDDPEYRVYGEVFELPFTKREMILHELDGYEGIYHSNAESEEYERVLTDVVLEDGRTIRAWVYNYKNNLPDDHAIASGDYIKYLRAQS